MTTETQAAQVDPLDAFVQEAIDQGSQQEQAETPTVESAPTEEVKAEEVPASQEEKPAEDGFQKRINKVTADKYTAQRERDALQVQLDKLSNTPSQEQVKAPTLEDPDIDYDEDKLRAAQISFGVQQELAKQGATQRQAAETVKAQQQATDFDQKVATLGKEDFYDKASKIPQLPEGVAEALKQSDSGVELIYHLSEHLDQADALANMTPMAAMMEIGRMSTVMNKKPEIKTSAAPEPIEPVKAGSALSSEVGDDMSIDDWMAKFG